MIRSLRILFAVFLLGTIPSLLTAQLLWESADRGIEGAEIFTYAETGSGTLFASTSLGLYRFDRSSGVWTRVIDAAVGVDWQLATTPDGVLHSWQFGHRFSTDDGRTWTRDTENATTVVAAAPDGGVALIGTNGRSTDHGISWTPVSRTALSGMINLGAGRLVARNGDSIFTSADTGRTWTHRATYRQFRTTLTAVGQNVIVTGFTGTHLSTDGGETWAQTSALPGFSASKLPSGELLVSSFATDRVRFTDGIYSSLDSGRTWSRLSAEAPGVVFGTSLGEIWATRSSGPAVSTDRGLTWVQATAGLRERFVEVTADADGDFHAYSPAIRPVLASIYPLGELYHSSDDAASWRGILDSVAAYRTLFPGALAAVTISVRDSVDVWILSSATRVTTDHGTTWQLLGTSSMVDAASNATNTAAVIVGPPSDTSMHVTTDGGATWTRRPFAYPSAQLAVAPSGRILAAIPADNVIAEVRADGSVNVLLEDRTVYDLIAVSDDVIVAVTSMVGGTDQRIERSTDGGQSWTSREIAHQEGPMTHVRGRLVMPIAIADTFYVMRSSDSGATWQESPIDRKFGTRIPTVSTNGTMLALRFNSLLRSMDFGATWEVIDTTRWRAALYSPVTNGRVLLQTQELRGLHRAVFISAIAREHDAPAAELRLRPIPARDRVVIDGLSSAGQISIVDVTGRVVGTRTLEAGDRSLDVSGLDAGIYFVRFTGERGTHVGTIVVAGR